MTRSALGRTSAVILAVLTFATVLGPASASGEAEDARTLRLRAIPTPNAPPVPPSLTVGGSDYVIGRQDLLEIRVFDLEELDQVVRVSDDGSITLPLLGRLEVAGLTKGGLEDRIAELLEKRFVRDPQVTVFVKEYESRKVAVSGSVKTPGTYEMLGSKTLLEMLSLAGGLDQEFSDEIIVWRRAADGSTARIPIDVEGLVYLADPALNIDVAPGDIIFVPPIQKIRIFVGGAVKRPDVYEVPSDEPVTVLKAITLAGGTTDRAAEKRVRVIRTEDGGERVSFLVDLRKVKRDRAEDPVLRKDDVVFVPEAFF